MPYQQKTWRSREVKHHPFALHRKQPLHGPFRKSYSLKPKKPRHILRNFIFATLIAGTGSVIIFVAFFLFYSRDLPSLSQIKSGSLLVAESTKIYDRSGTHLLYTIHGEENRTRIPLSAIPEYAKWATIATEDQDFYTRSLAIDFKGVARAVLGILKTRSLQEAPGGSTITQQLIKNMILTREKKLSRKIKEIVLAFRIEKAFSRDEILELYLNQIPYGSNAYGIEQAAQTFFGKSAKQLTISEAALLAALPKATTYYSPFGTHTDELFARHKVILRQMLDEGYVTEEQWKEASEQELVFTHTVANIDAPHFVIYVREILAHRYGEEEMEKGGLKVTTTLDYDLQKLAEQAIKEGALANDLKGADNAALVAVDPRTGEVLAMVGSRDYFDEAHKGNFNAALARRQPGSSFKPVVYAALFGKGYTPNTVLYDVSTDFDPSGDKEYVPKNFNGKEHGAVKIRQALAGSLNIPAVKALYLAGIYTVMDYAARLGYTTLDDPKRVGLSLALGSNEVKLLEHTAAFATLANDGVRKETTVVLKLEKQGEVLEEFKDGEGVAVFLPNAARMVTDILQDAVARSFIFGDNPHLKLGDIPAAVKTGTTNDFRDAWTVGYTRSLATGVWVGNNANVPMNEGADGSKIAAPIWQRFMKEAMALREALPFTRPDIPITGKPVLDGEIDRAFKVKIDKISSKLATDLTPIEYVEEVTYTEFHSILHYIDKDNPLGAPPVDPATDPQYKNWEAGIAAWAEEEGKLKELKKPPTETDDVHTKENAPTLTILLPQPNQTIGEDSYLIEIETGAKRRLSRVEYFVDGSFRESAGLTPFSRRIYFGSLPDGPHTITVTSFDDVGNRVTKEVVVQLLRGVTKTAPLPEVASKPSVTITDPQGGAIVSREAFPLAVRFSIQKPELVARVNLYYNDKNQNPIILGTKTEGIKEIDSIEWTSAPTSGGYPLYAIIIDKNGESYRMEIKVIIN